MSRVEVPVEDQAIIDGAPPEVSRIANSIGYVLAERGVRFTADDAIAAAYRVAEQSGPAVRVTEKARRPRGSAGKRDADPPEAPEQT